MVRTNVSISNIKDGKMTHETFRSICFHFTLPTTDFIPEDAQGTNPVFHAPDREKFTCLCVPYPCWLGIVDTILATPIAISSKINILCAKHSYSNGFPSIGAKAAGAQFLFIGHNLV